MTWQIALQILEILWSWPTLGFLLLLVFGKRISKALKGFELSKLSAGAGPFKAEWVKKLDASSSVAQSEEAKALAGQGPQRLLPAPEQAGPSLELDPASRILAAWRHVERRLRDWTFDGTVGRSGSSHQLVKELRADHRLSAELVDAIEELRRLRNNVAHSETSPSNLLATEYVETSNDIVAALDAIDDVESAREVSQLVAEFGVADATKVGVSRLPSGGIGSSIEMARSNAESRRGKFEGFTLPVQYRTGKAILLSRIEASRLVNAGAELMPRKPKPIYPDSRFLAALRGENAVWRNVVRITDTEPPLIVLECQHKLPVATRAQAAEALDLSSALGAGVRCPECEAETSD